MANETATYLLIIADREALAWVLREQRMAFPLARRREVSILEPGDQLFIHTTGTCFHSPNHDRSRIVGQAIARSRPVQLDTPVLLAGRSFELGCDIKIRSLAPFRDGVELPPLVPDLYTFRNNRGWMGKLRRPLLKLDERDAPLIRDRLATLERPPETYLNDYLRNIAEMLELSPDVRSWERSTQRLPSRRKEQSGRN